MKKNFFDPEIKISMFSTENLITASGEGSSLANDMRSNGGVDSTTTISFDELQSKLNNN